MASAGRAMATAASCRSPTSRPLSSTTGKPPYPFGRHQLQRLLDAVVRRDHHRRAVGDLPGGRRPRVGTVGDAADHDVAVGEDAGEAMPLGADREREERRRSRIVRAATTQGVGLPDADGVDGHQLTSRGHTGASGGVDARVLAHWLRTAETPACSRRPVTSEEVTGRPDAAQPHLRVAASFSAIAALFACAAALSSRSGRGVCTTASGSSRHHRWPGRGAWRSRSPRRR